MTMEITFTAIDIFDLKQQLSAFVGQFDHGSISAALPTPPEVTAVNVITKAREAKKAAGKAPVAAPEVEPDGEDVYLPTDGPDEDEDEDENENDVADIITATKAAAKAKDAPVKASAKDMLKVKADTILILQQAYADGKMVKLRKLLADLGDGAKSFPEVEPALFPKIAAAVAKGALA